jgi:methionyl-tRNA formyltransferase
VNESTLRLAFAGTPDLAAVVLETILKDKDCVVDHIYTQPDRPFGRGKRLKASAVKELSMTHNLTIYQPTKITDLDMQELLKNIDLLVVAAYGMILPAELLNIPRLGAINVHTSLLPRWRGAAPIQRAIEAGDEETGITIMQMDAGLDTGDILLQRSCDIFPEDNSGLLHDRLARLGADCLMETLDLLRGPGITPVKQDDANTCYAHKISKQEARIDWNLPAIEIERKIRAFNPAPVAYTELNGMRIKLWDAKAINDDLPKDAQAGQVDHISTQSIQVQTGKGLLEIVRLQLPGKKQLHVCELLNGNPGFFQDNPVFT